MKTITDNTLSAILAVLAEHEEFVFLDTAKVDADNTASMLFLHPIRRLRFRQGDDAAAFISGIEDCLREGAYVAGWIGYEFGYMLENVLQNLLCRPMDNGAVLADLGVFADRFVFDHTGGKSDFPVPGREHRLPSYSVSNVAPSQSRDEYVGAIARILDYIAAGDTYQVNYTLKLHFDFSGSPEHFYKALRRNQSVSYGAYIRWGNERVLSFAPEMFFQKLGGRVTVRPMKGTVKRGNTLAEDEDNRRFLHSDIKNRSENVMIVDLLRNDLGRLVHSAGGGEVETESLFDVETYETLLQMTSTITARSDSLGAIPLAELFKALFPCGSVTGAPKIRTMQIIDELEKDRRGVYTGAIGYFAPSGDAKFNVPIRTVVLRGDKGEMGIGSGIVYDSDPEQEWQECLLKGRFLTMPAVEFQLIETLLLDPDNGFWLLEEHLERLAASAAYFLFACDLDRVRMRLADERMRARGQGCRRVRLTLAKDGGIGVSSRECAAPELLRLPERPPAACPSLPRIGISAHRTEAQSGWLHHKTTMRALYDREFAKAGSAGLFDICFCNTDGWVTEGCITNIIVYKNGSYLTPPLDCGLLPGVMRQRLLLDREPPLVERAVALEDVWSADALFVCNSVRGVVQVRLAEN